MPPQIVRRKLLRNDPQLAEWMKKMSDPYGTVFEMRKEAALCKALNAITYSAKDHDQNPYRDTSSVNWSEKIGQFRATYGDLLADVWKAENIPVRFPWSSDPVYRDGWS